MGLISGKTGRYVDVPWGHDFDLFLGRMAETTQDYEGEELLHQIHRYVIEAQYVQIRFYRKVRFMLAICIALLTAIWLQLVL